MKGFKKIKSIIALSLVILIIVDLFPNVTVDAATNELTVHNIKVVNSDHKRGDATLLDCNGLYVLIDGGPNGSGYNQLYKYLNANCKRNSAGKIVLEAIIISHNHGDHYKGAMRILNDTTNFKVKKVYRTAIDVPTELKSACKNATNGVEIMTVGKIIPLKFNGSTVTVYGPAKNFTSGQSTIKAIDVNNSSTIVTADNGIISGIFMGDLYKAGFEEAIKKYGTTLFNGNYNVCKYGHHGVRITNLVNGKVAQSLQDEVKLYKQYINASFYYLSASKNQIYNTDGTSDPDIYTNYRYIKTNLTNYHTIAAFEGNLVMCVPNMAVIN